MPFFCDVCGDHTPTSDLHPRRPADRCKRHSVPLERTEDEGDPPEELDGSCSEPEQFAQVNSRLVTRRVNRYTD